jgi:hypothetical protein
MRLRSVSAGSAEMGNGTFDERDIVLSLSSVVARCFQGTGRVLHRALVGFAKQGATPRLGPKCRRITPPIALVTLATGDKQC